MLRIQTGLIADANVITGLMLEKTKPMQMPNVPWITKRIGFSIGLVADATVQLNQ